MAAAAAGRSACERSRILATPVHTCTTKPLHARRLGPFRATQNQKSTLLFLDQQTLVLGVLSRRRSMSMCSLLCAMPGCVWCVARAGTRQAVLHVAGALWLLAGCWAMDRILERQHTRTSYIKHVAYREQRAEPPPPPPPKTPMPQRPARTQVGRATVNKPSRMGDALKQRRGADAIAPLPATKSV
eukprot:scaffold1727_cov119-Isochrysis_galbana.AAC.8